MIELCVSAFLFATGRRTEERGGAEVERGAEMKNGKREDRRPSAGRTRPSAVSLVALVLASSFALQDAPIDPVRAAEVFAELEEAALADGGALWGHELLGPVLLVDPATRAVVANQPDERGLLAERDGVYSGTLPAEIGVANTAVDWAGVRWTMVMWPLPEEKPARVRLLVHECFHRIQPRLAHGGGDALSAHLDLEAGRTWLRLEMRALAAALRASGDARRAACEDALVFRAQRRALFADAAAKEAAFERHEGLAEYTGFALCGLDAAARAAAAAAKLAADEAKPSFVRSFAYATGPAYGLLLDALGADWRASIGPQSDLAALLADALGWTPPAEPARLSEEAERRARRHGQAEIAAAERTRAAERAAIDARNRARFVDGPVLVLPFGAAMRYSFDFNAITPLADAGNVYGTVYVVDEWGVLDAPGGALFVLGDGDEMLDARVPAPTELGTDPLAGDGWTLILADSWRLVPAARPGDWCVARIE
jgi:hypothetical protein